GTYVKWVVLQDGQVEARGQMKTRGEAGLEAEIERLIAAGEDTAQFLLALKSLAVSRGPA
ncbi:MAG: hypothetical protein ACREUZ_21915, partial [Burkholderiales bacterium]